MKSFKLIAYLLLVSLLVVGIVPSMAFATESSSAKVALEIEAKMTGDTPAKESEFTFVLTPEDNYNPVPDTNTVTIKGEGKTTFGEMVYTSPGIYEYTVKEKDSGLSNYTYDQSIYHVKVMIFNYSSVLSAEVSVRKDKNTEKSDAIVFTNHYAAPTQDAEKDPKPTKDDKSIQDAEKDSKPTQDDKSIQDAEKDPKPTQDDKSIQDAEKDPKPTKEDKAIQDAERDEKPTAQVTIKKVDSSGKLLSGAKLAIKDAKTKETVMEWTTNGKVKDITGELTAGKTYYLVEEEAPEGYLLAADVEFTVPKTSKDLEVKMVDPKKKSTSKLGSISVTKEVVLRDSVEEVELYTEDETYYVGLFTDSQGKHPYGSNFVKKVRIKKGSHSEPVVYSNLPDDVYYILETTKDGTPIALNEETKINGDFVICEVAEGTSNKVTISGKSNQLEGQVSLVNVYMKLTEGFSYRATITITVPEDAFPTTTDETTGKTTSKITGETTNKTTSKKKIYVGVFLNQTDTTPVTVIEMEEGGTYTVEVPLGGENGDEGVTYYLYETDESGNKIEESSLEYEVSLDKSNTESNLKIVDGMITDDDGSDDEATLKNTSSDSSGNNQSSKTSQSNDASQWSKKITSQIAGAVATGDKTVIISYLLLFVLAIVGIFAIVRRKKK